MPYLFVDSHEDIAYNVYSFNRNYLESAKAIRQSEYGLELPEYVGHATLGWADWQKANTVFIFSTIFLLPKRYQTGPWEKAVFKTNQESYEISTAQLDLYLRMAGDHPDKFSIIKNRSQMEFLWHQAENKEKHPIGLVLSMEGVEGIQAPEEMEFWWDQGVRLVGPVWAGTRFCGGTIERGNFTNEGRRLLEVMSGLGMGLDLSHMTEKSALEALDRYEGEVFASHANARALLRGVDSERNFTDLTIRKLAERGGVMGVVAFNLFLDPNWTKTSARDKVTLDHLANHIDYICQLTGCADHVGIGSDLDGGFGYPDIPFEMNTIADMPKLAVNLENRGYQPEDIKKIFGENWKKTLERVLPE